MFALQVLVSRSIFVCPKLNVAPITQKMSANSQNIRKQDLRAIRNYLMQFDGGAVVLEKNTKTGVATLVLNNQHMRNAMSGRMMVDFRDCVEELETWEEGKAVILHGKEGNFCSGGDLNFARSAGNPEAAEGMSTWMHDALTRLKQLPLVSVCLVQGFALGGGAEIAVSCDYIIAAENAKLGLVHGKMGIITAWGGSTRLASKIGQKKALDLLLTSKILNANDCVNIGLAEMVVPTQEAFKETEAWLSDRIQHHYSVVRAFKRVITKSETESTDKSLEHERNIFVPFWGCKINRDALAKNIRHAKD